MFNKPKNNPPPPPQKARSEVPVPPLPDLPSPGAKTAAPGQPAASAPSPARGASVLARDLVFEGNVTGQGELTIDGQIKGDVRVGRLVIGDTGSVEGSIQADNVEVRGRVVGSVTGQQVRLLGTAYVDGDINHEQLAIEVGAYFQGRCLQRGSGQAASATPAPASGAPAATNGGATAGQAEVVSLKPGA